MASNLVKTFLKELIPFKL